MTWLHKIALLFCLLQTVAAPAQKVIGPVTENEKKGIATVRNAIRFLKQRTTPVVGKGDSAVSDRGQIYKDFINRFYDLSYLKDSLKGSATFSYEQLFHLQMAIIYNIDHYLDVLPLDSVYLSDARFLDETGAGHQSPEVDLVVYYIISGKKFWVSTLSFAPDGKLWAIHPYIDFEGRNKDIDILGFYSRQKGFHDIQGKLWRPEAKPVAVDHQDLPKEKQ